MPSTSAKNCHDNIELRVRPTVGSWPTTVAPNTCRIVRSQHLTRLSPRGPLCQGAGRGGDAIVHPARGAGITIVNRHAGQPCALCAGAAPGRTRNARAMSTLVLFYHGALSPFSEHWAFLEVQPRLRVQPLLGPVPAATSSQVGWAAPSHAVHGLS